MLERLLNAADFSILADETTDISDRADLSVFVRYVDSNTYQVNEEFLGLVEVVGSKGAEALSAKIEDVLTKKGVDISLLRFHGMDGTNTMSGEKTGLQRRLRHLAPHSKYMNCRNHRLALVFVHLLKTFDVLHNVDAVILALWKMMKYSTVKSAILGEAQKAEGLNALKLLKAAPTRWLSHGEASNRLILRFEAIVNALDAIIDQSKEPEVTGTRNQFLNPDNALFLLLLADVLAHVNRFSKFLQKKNLIYSQVNRKLQQLKEALKKMEVEDGRLFAAHSEEVLAICPDKMRLARQMRGNNLLDDDFIMGEKIKHFQDKVKTPFLKELQQELDQAMKIEDEVLLAFDVFNVKGNSTYGEKLEQVQVLANFYGNAKSSMFQGKTVDAEAIIQNNAEFQQSIKLFLDDFQNTVKRAETQRNEHISSLVKSKQLAANSIESYIEEHPISPSKVYKDMYVDRDEYVGLMKLFKLSLLITPSTANVERGFSVLTLIHTKQRNSLSVSSLDKLMRLVLQGPDQFDDDTWELLVDNFRDATERRIEL